MRKQHLVTLLSLFLPLLIVAQSTYPYRDAQLKWGVIDHSLQVLATPEYDTVFFYQNDYTIAQKKGKFLHLNHLGRALYTEGYDSLGYFDYNYKNSGYEGLAIAKKGTQYGLISPTGQAADEFPITYDRISLETPRAIADYENPLIFIFQKDGKFGCKINGESIGKSNYDKIYVNFGDPKHLFFEKKGKGYFLTEKGKIKSTKNREFTFVALGDPLYFLVGSVEVFEENGLKGLKQVGTGKIVIAPAYQDIHDKEEYGYILITPDQKYGLAGHSGERLLDDQYKKISESPEKVLMAEEFSGRKGYVVNGKLLLP